MLIYSPEKLCERQVIVFKTLFVKDQHEKLKWLRKIGHENGQK